MSIRVEEQKTIIVGGGGPRAAEYSKGWDAIFGRKEEGATMTITKTVEQAIVLHRTIRDATLALEVLKESIRAEALERTDKDENGKLQKVEFETPEGVCTVAFPKDKAVPKKGADLFELRELKDLFEWEKLFEEKIVAIFKDDFEDVLARMPKASVKLVEKYVEWKEMTPTVTFPK